MKKIKIAVSGIGNRALPKNPSNSNWLGWVEQISKSAEFELVAVHDTANESLERIRERGYLSGDKTFTDLDLMLEKVELEAVLICNPAAHHAETIIKCVDRGLNILVEKPFVSSLADGKKCIEKIAQNNVVANVVQTWRAKSTGQAIYHSIQDGMLGKIGHVFFRYLRNRENPNLPKYIFQEKYPLLYAMGIHHFDLIRYVLQDDYESVSGNSFRPPWSYYESSTGVNLFFKTKGGVPVIYSGTLSVQNKVSPQEYWLIEGEKGSLLNESEWLEPPLYFIPRGSKEKSDLTGSIPQKSVSEQYDLSDRSILKNFYGSIFKAEKPICSAVEGLKSTAAVEAARITCEEGRTIYLKELL